MPERPGTHVDIQSVEAEITGAADEMRREARQSGGPSAGEMARLVRETMTQDAWRQARLSAE